MGTETCLLLLLFVFLLLLVKLNNPQMGTETSYDDGIVSKQKIVSVKLNNPQMGTETILIPI